MTMGLLDRPKNRQMICNRQSSNILTIRSKSILSFPRTFSNFFQQNIKSSKVYRSSTSVFWLKKYSSMRTTRSNYGFKIRTGNRSKHLDLIYKFTEDLTSCATKQIFLKTTVLFQ